MLHTVHRKTGRGDWIKEQVDHKLEQLSHVAVTFTEKDLNFVSLEV